MAKLTPQQMLKHTAGMAKNVKAARDAVVAVGLPKETASAVIYGDGRSVIQVGAAHEYGAGVPRRSFLRVPLNTKADVMEKATVTQFRATFETGQSVERSLGLIGVQAVDIVKGAFTSQGYGTWPELSPGTIAEKGSSQPLIDTGTLRNSITYVVRGS